MSTAPHAFEQAPPLVSPIREYRARFGLEGRAGDDFDRKVLRAFTASLSDHYFEGFAAWLKKQGLGLRQLGEYLHVNPGVRTRWQRGEDRPSWDNVLRFLALRGVEAYDVFPESVEVLLGAIVRALRFIRSEVAGLHGLDEIDDREGRCLAWACLTPDWWQARTEPQLDRVAQDIVAGLRRLWPPAEVVSPARLRQLVGRWFPAWALFDDALELTEWSFDLEART